MALADACDIAGAAPEILGGLRERNAKFGNHDAIDHQVAVGGEIHPVFHVHARERIAGFKLQRVFPVERIAHA